MNISDIITGPFRREVVEHLCDREYRRSVGLNPSSIAEGIVNDFAPLYVRHAYETASESTDSMIRGQYGHALLLEPETLEERWAVWDGGRRAGPEWKAFCEEHEDKSIVRSDDVALIAAAVTHALSRPEVKALIGRGVSEVSVFTDDCGVQCKGRLDWVNTDALVPVDVKFTNDIRPQKFGRIASGLAYTSKLACYHRWFAREHGVTLRPFQLLVIQLNDRRPHDCCICSVAEADLDYGWARARRMIDRVREAIERDDWPGVDGGAESVPLALPAWEIPGEEEVEFNE